MSTENVTVEVKINVKVFMKVTINFGG